MARLSIFLAMPEIQLVRPDHAPAVLDFERENRAYFAVTVPDRGDDYFARYDERHDALLAEQESGECYFHVVVDGEGAVLGRINLYDVADGGAELGYRIAERAAGRGLATWAVRQLFVIAAHTYGLTELRAGTTVDNPASQAVLTRTGFTVVGERTLSGRPGLAYFRSLADITAPAGTPAGAPHPR